MGELIVIKQGVAILVGLVVVDLEDPLLAGVGH